MLRKLKLINATVFILVASLLIFPFTFPASAVATIAYDFPNFSDADSMAFVEEHNIEIPLKLQQSDYLSKFTHELILQSYETPNTPFCFNFVETQAYAEEIRLTVKSYIDFATTPTTLSTTSYSLLYNKVRNANGSWVTSNGYYNPKWSKYNCYAFSINRAEQPHFYNTMRQYQPGDMSGVGTFQDCYTINQLAEIIRADLIAMGYSDISLSSTMPSINSSKELICVRMKYDADYHFMRYDLETNAWYHKPGTTAVLKYNYVPTNDRLWYNEYCDSTGVAHPATSNYDSAIVFITYSKNQINLGQNNSSREYIEPEKDVFCELNANTAGHFDINLESSYSFEYEIFDEDFDVVSSGTGNSIDTCLFTSGAGKYYLRMNFVSCSQLYYVDVSIESHSHSYSASHKWLSYTKHRSECCCGMFTTGPHVVASGSFTGGQLYATCLICGGLATAGVTIYSIAECPNTINEGFILPN